MRLTRGRLRFCPTMHINLPRPFREYGILLYKNSVHFSRTFGNAVFRDWCRIAHQLPKMQPQCSFFFSTSYTVVFVFTHISLVLAQTCYFPDQETVAKDYIPCNSSAIDDVGGTTCCGGGASCLSNNLCYLIYDMSINTGACSDRTWNSPGCFQGCPSGQFSRVSAAFRAFSTPLLKKKERTDKKRETAFAD